MPTFETQGGTSPGVTILAADGTVHTAHTTAGFTEAVTGSGVYNYPHPSPGTLLEFVFDAAFAGTAYYASVWDDGLSPQGAAEAAIVAQPAILTSEYDHAKDDVLTPLALTATEANATANKDEILASITPLVPDIGIEVTQDSVGTDGIPLGVVMPFGMILVQNPDRTVTYRVYADADGEYHFKLPEGSVWTLTAYPTAGDYNITQAEFSTVEV